MIRSARAAAILFAVVACACTLPCICTAEAGAPGTLASALMRAAPSVSPRVIDLATHALACARREGYASDARTLSIIDYSRPSTERRLWVFDLRDGDLLFREWVAHGRNSGGNLAEHFSNKPGSLESSLGSFVTLGTYVGHNGYSLRLQGLDAGFNDNALERAIVMHGAGYVGTGMIHEQGRLGRSFGCPAVRPGIARQLIDAIRDGSFVFAYYPEQDWLQQSRLLGDCAGNAAVALAKPDRPDATTAQRHQRKASAKSR